MLVGAVVRVGRWCTPQRPTGRRHSITVSAADAQTTHRRDAAGNVVTRSRVPLVPDGVEFVVEAVVERVGPECGVLLPATAFTDVRLLRPTRLTAANAEIRQLAGTMADQDTLATADRFCAYMHDPISYAHGVTSVATTAAETLAGGRRVCQVAAHVMRSPGALPHFVTEIDGAGHPLHPRPLATRERAAGHHSPTGGPARSSNR
jgi:transglutaminase-like putative cysteine protease